MVTSPAFLAIGSAVLAALHLPAPAPPIRLAEMLYARLSVRLTLASGGLGRYGTVWGVWHRAQITPGLGYYQPDFQCAEYVMRSLRAAGYNIATPPPTAASWPDLVNVDRAMSYLEARGIARPAPLGSLVVGDALVMHYLRGGPDNWSHFALVQGVHPLRLAAHDRNRWGAPLSTYPPYQAILGLHAVPNPHPPSGLVPLGQARWGEVALRDPPLRTRPGGRAGRRLYLGLLVRMDGAARAAGSLTGWLHVRSGSLAGWVNGDAVTRLAVPPPTASPLLAATPPSPALRGSGPLAVRAAWGTRLYVDAGGCPVPAWTGKPCGAPYLTLAKPMYPMYTVVSARPLALTLSPAAGSVPVWWLPPATPVAAERVGPYAALFAPGGPANWQGVLYAPGAGLTWRKGGVFLFLRATTVGGQTIPAQTAAAAFGIGLTALRASYPSAGSSLNCATWPGPNGVALGAQPPSCLYVPPSPPTGTPERS